MKKNKMNDFKILVKNSSFTYLWASQILSQLTINLMNFLLLARLYMVTGSSIATSLLWVAYCLPTLFLGPIGAATVDLFSRRKILMITNLFQALVIFSYIFINQGSIFILYAVVLIYSILNQFYVPAESAYLPSAVSKADLAQGNSLFFITAQATIILGFGFAGIVQRLIGFDGALIVCSIFIFTAFISTSFLPEVRLKKKIPDEFEKALKTFFGSLVEGYEFIKNNKSVLYPLLFLLGVQAGLAIIVVSLPVIAVQVLNISVNLSGVSVVVPAGIGAILGAAYIPRLMKKGIRKITIIKYSLAAVVFSLLAISLAIPYFSIFYRVTITTILIIIGGFGFVGAYLPTLTFLQSSTPLWLRGRVFGSLYFLITLVTIFPVLFSGAITEIFGIRTVLVILALSATFVLAFSIRRGQSLIREEF